MTSTSREYSNLQPRYSPNRVSGSAGLPRTGARLQYSQRRHTALSRQLAQLLYISAPCRCGKRALINTLLRAKSL